MKQEAFSSGEATLDRWWSSVARTGRKIYVNDKVPGKTSVHPGPTHDSLKGHALLLQDELPVGEARGNLE